MTSTQLIAPFWRTHLVLHSTQTHQDGPLVDAEQKILQRTKHKDVSIIGHMFDKDVIEDIGNKITSLLPEGGRQLQADLESNVRAVLQSSLSRLNLVTREEFDVQTALLQRTREKLEQIQQQLDALEKKD